MNPIILLLLLAVLPFQAPPKSEWQTFVSQEGGFAVTFPGEPTGDSNESGLRYKVDLGPRTFAVVCAKQFNRSESPEKTLNDNADEFMKTCRGKLIKKSPITVARHPGVAIKFKTTEPGGVTEARYYLVKNQLFILLTFTRNGTPEDDAQRFLNSFKLLQ
jgi:hypothetical protein